MKPATEPDPAAPPSSSLALPLAMGLDPSGSASLDRITRLAREIFEMPIALCTLADGDRQWSQSCIGLTPAEVDKSLSFCSHAIAQRAMLVVEDAQHDPRFARNPYVQSPPYVRFYAGALLVLPSGRIIGTLCVMDVLPRTFSPQQRLQLERLAAFAVDQIALHRRVGRISEVTGLPNRTQMIEDIESEVPLHAGATRCLLLIDVMEHQALQDAMRAVGIAPLEAALREIAAKLQAIVGADGVVYHVGETRFSILLRGCDRAAHEAFTTRLIAQFENRFESGGLAVNLELLAGLAEYTLVPGAGSEALRRATAAMHEAGARSRRFGWHDAAIDNAYNKAFSLMRSVSRGLVDGQFRLVYQPKFNVAANTFTGVEALARWRHPVHGDVSPGEFVPLIEKTALIHEFTEWVMHTAFVQLAQWRREGIVLTMAVNVSSRNLDRPDFVDSVRRLCAEHGVDPAWLHVECTETAILTSDATHAALTELRAMGSQVSLDDFGMGYSNLSCLRALPVQMLKLDQSLIKPMETDPPSHELVKSLILLGHSLGFRMLAEGVETERTRRLLVDAGCDALQGYYLGRPMEAAQIPDFLSRPLAWTL